MQNETWDLNIALISVARARRKFQTLISKQGNNHSLPSKDILLGQDDQPTQSCADRLYILC